MFCKKCGFKNDEGNKFCNNCGSELDNNVVGGYVNNNPSTTTNKSNKEDGTNTINKNVEITPEIGFTNENVIRSLDIDNKTKNRYFKGYAKINTYTTDDPRIIRSFIHSVYIIVIIISIILIISSGSYFSGICFMLLSGLMVLKVKLEIDEKEKELMKNPNYNPKDKTVVKEFYNEIKKGFKDSVTSLFTKQTFKWFVKISLPIYIVASLICFIILCILADVNFGLSMLIILTVGALIFYFILSKICKY